MRIVVGVDGSDGSRAALRWARREAEARGWPVVALLAYGFYGRPEQVQDRAGGIAEEALSRAATEVLRETIAEVVEADDPELTTAPETMIAGLEPVDALFQVAEPSDLLVIGSRGLGPVRRLLLGSVSTACVRHAAGPVVVVRAPQPRDERPVVVGVDGSAESLSALDWAIEHAAARRLALHVIRAWSLPPDIGVRMEDILAAAARREQTDKELHELVERRSRGAGIRVTAELVDGAPAPTLISASDDAELLVVGSRGAGGFSRLLLGSTSATCSLHARTSVAVVHPAAVHPVDDAGGAPE